MLARLTGRPVANILPTSMTTDAHAAHFRHSYTKDKRDLVTRLRRIEGQARGIQRLVEDEAYCLDILQQVEAMTAAADQVALLVLEDHIDGCLTHAVESGQGQPYVDEVMAVVRRTMGRRGPRSGTAARETGVPQGGTTALPARSLPLAHWASKAAELLPEYRQLLAAALDQRIEAEHRLEPLEARPGPRGQRVEMLPFQDVPVLAFDLGTQPR